MLSWVAFVGNYTDAGSPFGKFTQPIRHGGEGHNDMVKTALLLKSGIMLFR
jgi:hypothetical protein